MENNYAYIALFAAVGIAFAIITMWFSWVLRPTHIRDESAKCEPYECGEIPFSDAWKQFRVAYYIFALIYVIFAIEAVFMFPWAKELLNFKETGLGLFVFVEMMIFVTILLIGLLYAWRKGVLKWE